MSDEQFFKYIDSEALCQFIKQAEESVIYAAPGIRNEVAEEFVKISNKLGDGMVTVCLDVSEHTVRMGFGDIDAISQLEEVLIINNIPQLRFALIIVDGVGYSFSPTALYLESESSTSLGFNSIKMTDAQVLEATTRLSPAAKAIALATCTSEEEYQKISTTIPEIPNNPVQQSDIEKIDHSIKINPVAKFDITRQVRVYSSYLQYVEVKMTGVAIQRQKISIPKVFQSLGDEDKELQNRLNTSFDLLEKDNKLSSKELEDKLKQIRDDFSPSLGKKHGRVMLKCNRDIFDKEIESLKSELNAHSKNVKENLQKSIDESIDKIAKYYTPIVERNPPNKLIGTLGKDVDSDQIFKWAKRQLERVFPSAEGMIQKMELSVIFKDITYENLNDKEFLDAVFNAFPDTNWEKAHQEYLAASESSS
ncbi:hypothetical protein [Litorilituus sediminis]|uniref:Uncharacterized protein n=1 Tax=Litorilituus sediminis TaxID=718192 RepID=A0A4P6P6X6_9GAMM|nr:hypothetical protein [Litorilituus sediminis]QBG37264.1 hypothetical protein EMK97_16740 [Litorilituus sediminis]